MSWNSPPPSYQQVQGSYGAAPRGGAPYRPAAAAPPPGQYGYQAPPPQQAYGAAPPRQPYGAPAPQQAYGAPPTQRPQGAYGARPAQGAYGAQPPQGAYAAPPPHRPQAAYGAPQQSHGAYGAQAPNTGYQPPQGYAPPGGHPGARPGGYAPQPPPGVSPDLWGWFQAVDADRSGKITAQELQQALHNGNWTPFNAETCRLMIGMFDRDRSGTIDIHEFSALWKYIQDWKNCFDRFDTDRSGNINANELMQAFKTFGYNLSMNFVTLCLKSFDRRNLGSMNFDDFIQCCVMLKALTEKFREKDTQQNGQIRVYYEDFLKMVLDNSVIL